MGEDDVDLVLVVLGNRAGGGRCYLAKNSVTGEGGGGEEQGANMSDLYLSVALQV